MLYNWPASLNACPEGWFLPSDHNWKIIEGNSDSQYPVGDPIWDQTDWRGFDVGKNLKSETGWSTNTGTNIFGFNALPGGYRSSDGGFHFLSFHGRWWSSDEGTTTSAWNRSLLQQYDNSRRNYRIKSFGFSVRCFNHEIEPPNQPPSPPANPSPIDSATNQPINITLSWESSDPEGDPITFDVYFGTEQDPPLAVAGISEQSHTPAALEYSTTYYWKIAAHDDQGNSTVGEVWSFITGQLVLSIGDSYGGGKVAHIFQPGEPGYISGEVHGIIAAPTDQSTNAQWGCHGTLIGGTSNALGTGAANTAAIVAGCSTELIAARICDNLELNGYNDWYLPSKDELNKLYINRAAIGGFTSSNYWSSSELSSSNAWLQSFGNGLQDGYSKNAPFYFIRVRAVRSF